MLKSEMAMKKDGLRLVMLVSLLAVGCTCFADLEAYAKSRMFDIKPQHEIIVFATVGISDPDNTPKDVGLPKNAVLSSASDYDFPSESGIMRIDGYRIPYGFQSGTAI